MQITGSIFLAILFLAGCRKGEELPFSRQPATLDTPLHIQMDSMCLHAPNLITPNGDGINDRFFVLMGESPRSHSLTITNPNGTIVFTTTDQESWSGYDAEFIHEPGPIPYLYELQIITAGGISHSAKKVFHVVRDGRKECITGAVAPEFGDQYDPRRCDVPWPTNDQVCIH
jgi:hypothetical protein